MRSPFRPRNFGFLLFVGFCTLVLFILRRNVELTSKRYGSTGDGILIPDSDSEFSRDENSVELLHNQSPAPNSQCYQVSPLTCLLNSKVSPGCYLVNNVEAVVPLNLIKSQYEAFGGVHRESNTLYIQHVNVAIPSTTPDQHEPTGRYMFFHKYNVENRPRVKLVIADEGIPISTQWDPRGYPYAIQIAQFGLSHYTKLLDLKQRVKNVPNDQDNPLLVDLDIKKSMTQASFVHLEGQQNWKQEADGSIKFFASNSKENTDSTVASTDLQMHLLTNATWRYFVLAGKQWHKGSSVTVRLLWPRGKTETKHSASKFPVQFEDFSATTQSYYDLVYTCESATRDHTDPYLFVSEKRHVATFWMPRCAQESQSHETGSFRVHLARDLFSDLLKAFGANTVGVNRMDSRKRRNDQTGWPEGFDLSKPRIQVLSIRFKAGAEGLHGGGLIDELRLGISHEELPTPQLTLQCTRTEMLFHEYRFLAASSWFRRNQKPDGTWTIPVARNFRGRVPIKPGWPSAMGQGHGLSLLVRAHNYTKNLDYLRAAQNAVRVFNLSVAERGVRSLFLDQPSLPWYEEYPTEPGNFVLNGFIYSLFGLYDLTQVESRITSLPKSRAAVLLEAGLVTLSATLPLFDSGSGSFYDLRHVMQPSETQTVVARSAKFFSLEPTPSLDAGPNRARWDYHAVHIRQLRILANVDHSSRAKQWLTTADRWTSYMAGFRSPHN